MSIGVRSRNYFSIPYLCGAADLTKRIAELEGTTTPSDQLALTHRALVVSAITSAAGALESMINETFADCAEANGGSMAMLPESKRELLSGVWGLPKTERLAVLDKFDLAHLLVTGKLLDHSSKAWERANWVIKLRNEFIHYKPSWQAHGPREAKDETKWERSLSTQFVHNRFAGNANPFFPDKLLGHGCSAWCFNSVLAFADFFWASIGVTPVYESHRPLFAI